jgi:hypothetical protein
MNINDVINYINNTASDADRGQIQLALSKHITSTRTPKRFAIGDRVQFNSQARPNYIQGLKATITKVNRARVVIKLDAPVGRFGVTPINCPTSIIECVAGR